MILRHQIFLIFSLFTDEPDWAAAAFSAIWQCRRHLSAATAWWTNAEEEESLIIPGCKVPVWPLTLQDDSNQTCRNLSSWPWAMKGHGVAQMDFNGFLVLHWSERFAPCRKIIIIIICFIACCHYLYFLNICKFCLQPWHEQYSVFCYVFIFFLNTVFCVSVEGKTCSKKLDYGILQQRKCDVMGKLVQWLTGTEVTC